MNKLAKILAAVLVVFLVVIVGIYFVASRYLTPERIEALIVPPLEKATGLQVSIGEIKRSGFFGIKVSKIDFKDPKTHQNIIAADELRLALKLSPLLQGKLVVSEVAFIRPRVLIVREKDGTINLVRYFGPKEAAKPAKEVPPKEAPPKELALVFQNLKIEKALIEFVDLKKELPPAKATFSLAGGLKVKGTSLVFSGDGSFDLLMNNYALVKGLSFKAQATGRETKFVLNGGKILSGTMKGEILLSGQKIKGNISLNKASFKEAEELAKALKPYLFPEAELPRLDGNFDVEIALAGTTQNPLYALTFYPKPLLLEQKPYTLQAEGLIRVNPEEVSPKLKVAVNGEKMDISGKISLKGTPPYANLLITAEKFNLKSLLPEEEKANQEEIPSNKEPQKNKPLVLPIAGNIQFKAGEVCYTLCAEDVKANIKLAQDRIDLKNLNFLFAGAISQVNGNVSELSKTPKLKFAYSVAGADLPTLGESFFPESNYFVSGKVWSEGAFSALGLGSDAIKKTLSGQGNAKFLQVGLKENAITTLAAQLLHVDELKNLMFENGSLGYTVKDGLVNLKGHFAKEGLALDLLGQVGLDGRLNLSPKLKLSGKLAKVFAKKFPGASLFKTKTGYEIPLTIKGTVEKPKVSLVGVEEKVKEKIEEKAVEQIFKFLGN
ncbi:DUF748 domain-containing protein [Thermodesulfatator atlanticus]|uniref:DUF748 domain-containing protein n=1 Tax=Thermodesulfatator atlanticus TaxID=501497 RepID=UPI0003B562B0|nr:AsmA family protein [Thermodesulfatator atlanticus]